MHKYTVYAAYGWLALSGVLHFFIDVVSQYLRGKRAPSAETTLYYGMNSAFSLGQVGFGLLGLWVAWRAMDVLNDPPAIILSVAAAFGWLAVTFIFLEYWEPKLSAAVFCGLIIAAVLTAL